VKSLFLFTLVVSIVAKRNGGSARSRQAVLASRHRSVLAAAFCVAAFVTCPANAKRTVPRAVEPVTVHGVTYSAPASAMGFVVAFDESSRRELWRQRIYRVHLNPSLERDVQDVFITSLTLRGGSLVIANEHGERYALDLSTNKVTRESDRHT
jgi:hypothetical protein